MVERRPVFKLDALDVGWGSIAAVTWASPIIPILIFAILLVNIVSLVFETYPYVGRRYLELPPHGHRWGDGLLCYQNVFLGVGASVVMAIVTFKILRLVTTDGGKLLFGIPGVSYANCVRLVFLSDCLAVEPGYWIVFHYSANRNSRSRMHKNILVLR